MNTLAIQVPSLLQTPEQQLLTLQTSLSQVQSIINGNATTALAIAHVQSTTDSTTKSTASGSLVPVPGYSWTLQSQGGLFFIDINLNGTGSGALGLYIDGVLVLKSPVWGTLLWRVILSVGQHVITAAFSASSGSVEVNGGGFLSSASIVEFPENVQSNG